MPDRRPPRRRSAQRPAERGRRSDPVRLAAYTVMRAVDDGAYANLELPKVLRERRIDGRDAAFATELVYGARGCAGSTTGWSRSPRSDRRREIDGAVLDTLRLGVHQLLGMRVATHAAVDETVALARQVNGIGASGFVNAVLRRVSERDREAWRGRGGPARPGAVGARRPCGPAIPSGWSAPCGRPCSVTAARPPTTWTAQLDALLAADNAPPRVTLVARPGLADVERAARGRRLARPAGPDRRRPRPRRPGRRSRPCARAEPPCRTRGRSWSPWPSPRRRSRAPPAGSAGSTCAPARAARPDCSRAWPWNATPTSSPTRSTRTGPTWSAGRWPP